MKLFSKRSPKDILGFDFCDDCLKIAHVRATPLKREVVNLATIDTAEKSDEEITHLIQKTISGFGIKNPRGCLTVPMQPVITRSIEIPSRDPAEIKEIVNLQASRHTPYSRSEIIIETLSLGVIKESYTRVLLVIAPRESVVRGTSILEMAGIKVERVLFPPEGIAHACSKILNAESGDEVTAIVHMDAAFTNFIVMQRSKVLFVRGISIGARHLLEEKGSYSDPFVDELQKSLESYTSDEAGPQPSVLLLTGVAAETDHLDDLFRENLHLPIKHQTYFEHFAISKEAQAAASSAKHLSFFNVIAPLLVFDQMEANLITEEQKLQTQMQRRSREIMTAGVLVMVLLGLLVALFASKAYFKRSYLDDLLSSYASVKEDAKRLEKLFARTQVVKGYLANRGNSIETLAELYTTLPEDVLLTEIRYEEGTRFSVKGTSESMASVFSFVTNLEKSKKFQSVKTKYVTSRNEDGVDMADFEIVSVINNVVSP